MSASDSAATVQPLGRSRRCPAAARDGGAEITRIISPSLAEIDRLPTKLTAGERTVLAFFCQSLAIEWEIYVQPHLNGLRPDFVLLHPENGIAVYEVKDWDLGAMEYRFAGSPKRLWASHGAERFPIRDPVAQVVGYKQEVLRLYCPSLNSKAHFGLVTAGVILTVATDEQIYDLFDDGILQARMFRRGRPQNVLAGREQLDARDLKAIFPLAGRVNQLMSDEIASELRSWLEQPEFSVEQSHPLELDSKQKRLVQTRTKYGYRRIKGAAGSGKSVVLAARAAELAKQGKKVLVVTFNITLLNYLQDLAKRWARGPFMKSVTWLNYHAWERRVCHQNGYIAEYKVLRRHNDEEGVLNEGVTKLVGQILDDGCWPSACYDAVLVDEGQDFHLSWWNNLRKAVRVGGELLLVTDPTQDIYGTARSWTEDAMTGAGFRGEWVWLRASYRLPPDMVSHAQRFAQQFLPQDEYCISPVPAQKELFLYPAQLRWIQARSENVDNIIECEVLRLAKLYNVTWADIVLLVSSKQVGREFVCRMERRGFSLLHTFSEESHEARNSKLAFFKGEPRLKATTIHSFKGWEGSSLVVHLSNLCDNERLATAYAALTRVKRRTCGSYLTVVCDWPDALAYGETWPDFVQTT